MKLSCQIKQCFEMCGEHATCNATINLVSEKILLNEEPSFDDPDEFESFLGAESFEAHITYGIETNIFLVDQISTHSFQLSRNDMEKF